MNKIKKGFGLLAVFVFALTALMPAGVLAADAASGELSAEVSASTLTSMANSVAFGEDAILYLPQISGRPVSDSNGQPVLPTVSWKVGDSSDADIDAYADAYQPDAEEMWTDATLEIPAEALDEGDNPVTVVLYAGEGNTWAAVRNGVDEGDGRLRFTYHVYLGEGTPPDTGELSAYVPAPDLTSTRNIILVGDDLKIFLPWLSGVPAENAQENPVLPTVSWKANARGEDNLDAYADYYDPSWDTPWNRDAFLTIPADALVLGENVIELTLHAGEGNIWWEVRNGRRSEDGREAVFRYYYTVVDGPRLVWDADEPLQQTISVGQTVTLHAMVEASETDEAVPAENCEWNITVGEYAGDDPDDSAAEFVSWEASGDGTSTPSLTVTALAAPELPIIISLTAEVGDLTQTTPIYTILIEDASTDVIIPGTDSPIIIEGTGEDRCPTGIVATSAGTTTQEFFELLNCNVPEDTHLQIDYFEGALEDEDIVATGNELRLAQDGSGTILDSAIIVVSGDVLGTGIMNISQLVRMAASLTGTQPLDGWFLYAGDFNMDGSIDITDLTHEAQLLLAD